VSPGVPADDRPFARKGNAFEKTQGFSSSISPSGFPCPVYGPFPWNFATWIALLRRYFADGAGKGAGMEM
jgi:hypothetical protein